MSTFLVKVLSLPRHSCHSLRRSTSTHSTPTFFLALHHTSLPPASSLSIQLTQKKKLAKTGNCVVYFHNLMEGSHLPTYLPCHQALHEIIHHPLQQRCSHGLISSQNPTPSHHRFGCRQWLLMKPSLLYRFDLITGQLPGIRDTVTHLPTTRLRPIFRHPRKLSTLFPATLHDPIPQLSRRSATGHLVLPTT